MRFRTHHTSVVADRQLRRPTQGLTRKVAAPVPQEKPANNDGRWRYDQSPGTGSIIAPIIEIRRGSSAIVAVDIANRKNTRSWPLSARGGI